MDAIIVTGIFLMLGVVALYIGKLTKSGALRGMYFLSVPGMYVMGHVYAAFPIGIAGILAAILVLIVPRGDLLGQFVTIILGIGFVSSIVFIAWQPRFLKPWWLIWLEDNYHGIERGALLEVAGRNPNKFAQLTPDEASLKAWAESTLDELRNPPGK